MDNKSINLMEKVVCSHMKCQTNNAKYLWIMDLDFKVKNDQDYDIGGTYSDGPDYWFMYRVRKFIRNTVLLSLFVCNRRAGSFTLKVGDTWQQIHSCDDPNFVFGEDPSCFDFYSLPANTYSFVTAMQLCEKELKSLHKSNLYIEVQIVPDINFSQKVKDNIKLHHDFGKLRNDKESSDLILISSDNSELVAHKAIIGNYSSVLKKQLETSTTRLELSDSASNLDLLLEFIYTGSIVKADEKDQICMLNLGIKYDVHGLIELSTKNLKNDINVDNAISILKLAHIHGLDEVSKKVSVFIKDNPAVFETQSWKELNDVELTKKLLVSISNP